MGRLRGFREVDARGSRSITSYFTKTEATVSEATEKENVTVRSVRSPCICSAATEPGLSPRSAGERHKQEAGICNEVLKVTAKSQAEPARDDVENRAPANVAPSSTAAGTGGRVVQTHLQMSVVKKEGRMYLRLGQRLGKDQDQRFFFGASVANMQQGKAVAHVLADELGVSTNLDVSDRDSSFAVSEWLQDAIQNERTVGQRIKLRELLLRLDIHVRCQWLLDAKLEDTKATGSATETEYSVKLLKGDLGEWRDVIEKLLGSTTTKLAFGGKATLEKKGLNVGNVRRSAVKLLSKDDLLDENDVENLSFTPTHTKQIIMAAGVLPLQPGNRADARFVLSLIERFSRDKYIGVYYEHRDRLFKWHSVFTGDDENDECSRPRSGPQARIYGYARTERLAVARREAFVKHYAARFPEAFRRVIRNNVGVFGEGALTAAEEAAANKYVHETFGDKIVDTFEELNVVLEDGEDVPNSSSISSSSSIPSSSRSQPSPSPPFDDIFSTRHLRAHLSEHLAASRDAFPKSTECKIIGTWTTAMKSKCSFDCVGWIYVFKNPLFVNEYGIFATKSGITNGYGYHSCTTSWCRRVENAMSIPALRFALLRAASKRQFFKGPTRVAVYVVSSCIHVHEAKALGHAARTASLRTLVPNRTEMFSLGGDEEEAVRRNAAYVAAFDEYARNSSEISLVAELEIPPSGAFGRGAWTAKDQQVVDRIIDSARIANEQGELVNFDRSG